MQRDRMFHVLVLGGIGLVVACGTASSSEAGDAGSTSDASAGDASNDAYFPSELPVAVDASDKSTDSGADVEAGFPIEK
jgi:hypothetical protein